MARIKGAMMTRKRRNKILGMAKGYWGAKSTHYKMANQAVMKSLSYAYVGRKQKKRDFRLLGIPENAPAVLPEYYHRRGKTASVQPFHPGGRSFRTAQAQPQLQTLPDRWEY